MAPEPLQSLNPLRLIDRDPHKESLSEAVLPKLDTELPHAEMHENPYQAVFGKVSVLEAPTLQAVQELMQNFERTARENRQTKQVLVSQLDKLPFEVATVSDALRHIGIPETRIRQLLLQVGLQSLEYASPNSLSPAQLRVLCLVAALHGSENTVILARPFQGLEPHVARSLADFIAVAALEKKKSFVLVDPGHTVEGWKGSEWAVWKPFGGMNLNIPQELLELQMARRAHEQTKETIQQRQEKNPQEAGIQDLEQQMKKSDPFHSSTKESTETAWRVSQRTAQSDGKGFFSLPVMNRKRVTLPDFFDFFSGNETGGNHGKKLAIAVFFLGIVIFSVYSLSR